MSTIEPTDQSGEMSVDFSFHQRRLEAIVRRDPSRLGRAAKPGNLALDEVAVIDNSLPERRSARLHGAAYVPPVVVDSFAPPDNETVQGDEFAKPVETPGLIWYVPGFNRIVETPDNS